MADALWSRRTPLRERVCYRLTRHRWSSAGGWRYGKLGRSPFMLPGALGSLWHRTETCRLCGGSWVHWQTYRPEAPYG